MGFFDWINKIGQTSNSRENVGTRFNSPSQANQSSEYKIKIKSDIQALVNFYNEFGKEYDNANISIDDFVRKVAPNADSHTCPHCGVIHDFKATRARKCPDCREKMIVRAGKFLTNDQVTTIEDVSSNYYEKSSQINQLKNCIESIQSYVGSGNDSRAFVGIAEGYQACAMTHNKSHPEDRGFTYWDYSWASLQRASDVAVMAANGHPLDDWLWNDYLDSLYARAQHCLRELKNSESKKSQNKYAHLSIEMLYYYLDELVKFGRKDDWNRENAIRMIYVSKSLGGLSEDDFSGINTQYLKDAEAKGRANITSEVINSVNDYIFLETDPQKLKWMIY